MSTGSVRTKIMADGTLRFELRFRANGRRQSVVLHSRRSCDCGCGGGWDEPGARTELGNILALVRVGMWQAPEPAPGLAAHREASSIPTFAEYAPDWLDAKVAGVYGDKPIGEQTRADYDWRLRCHLVPFFGAYRLDEIDYELCVEFKAFKLREAKELRDALAAGADLRDRRGRRLRPLGPASIKKLVTCLAAVLDDAIEDKHISHNPARGKRMRVHVPKPSRTFLEMDELAAVLDAAADQDRVIDPDASRSELRTTAAKVAELLIDGLRPGQIAAQLGIAKSTVSFHTKQLQANVGRGYASRHFVCEMLGRGGPRASELSELKIGQMRIHDPDGARFHIPDAKTDTGIRAVEMSPDLVVAAIAHLSHLRLLGLPTGPDDWLVPNLQGGKISRQRIWKIVQEAAELASARLVQRGLPPLPNVTPHSLRRTYISIALLANNFDVKWVMDQVGHADSKMTMDVYAQLEQRVKRNHGTSFDRLVRQAREQLHGRDTDESREAGEGAAADPGKPGVSDTADPDEGR